MLKIVYNEHDQLIIDKMDNAIRDYEASLVAEINLRANPGPSNYSWKDRHHAFMRDSRRRMLLDLKARFMSVMIPKYVVTLNTTILEYTGDPSCVN